MGTIIPQARWFPDNVTDYRNHVAEAVSQMPVFFMQKNGTLGHSLDDAINGCCQNLRDARVLAQLGGKQRRISVSRYVIVGLASLC